MGGQATVSDPLGFQDGEPFGPKFYLNGYFGDAPGWQGPSYQADLYLPYHVVPGQSVVFGVMQGGVDNFGKGYFNGGLGYRQYFPEANRILGVWGWADFDDTRNIGYTRFGGSFESLGKYFDTRFNYYILEDQGASTVSQSFTGTPFFRGNFIELNRRTVLETAFDGFDLEFGGPLPFLGRYGVSGYVGPYFLHSNLTGGQWGVEGRINVAATDNFQVNVTMQHDNVFNTTTFVNISLALPDGVPTKWFKPQSVLERLSSMVIRKDRIPVLDTITNEGVPFLTPPGTTPGNPQNTHGDLPVFVEHVDPNAPAGSGDGTFEHPFGSLEQARLANTSRVDIFSIAPRTDGTGTNLMTTAPFQLFNYQHVWGTTVAHLLPTTAGTIVFPATNPGGALPLVSNANNSPTSSVFVLANVDEISGLHISGVNQFGGPLGNGITNGNGPIIDFNINQNQFTDYTNAVVLFNAFGDGSSLHLNANNFSNNTLTGTSGVSQNGLEIVENLNGTLTVSVAGNTATGNAANGFLIETATVGATINAAVDGNTVTNNTGNGIHFETNPGTINVTSFTDNTVTNNQQNGVWFDANGGGTINVQNFQGNTITGNGTANVSPIGSDPDGVLVSATGLGSSVNAEIGVLGGAANTISNNGNSTFGGAGIHLFTNLGGTINGSIVNNVISGNASFGVNVDALLGTIGTIGASPTMAGAIPFVIANNTISGNGNAGIFAAIQNNSTAGLQIVGNTLVSQVNGPTNPLLGAGTHGAGIHIITKDTSFLWDTDIENNFIGISSTGSAGGNIGNGIFIQTFGNSRLADTLLFPGLDLVKIVGNTIKFNGDNGVLFQRNGDSLVNNVLIQGNEVSFNVHNGLDLVMNGGNNDISNGGAPFVIDFRIIQNNLNNNGINGAIIASTGDAVFRTLIVDNQINNNGQDGINSSTLFFSQIAGNWTGNQFNNNGRNGITLTDGNESLTSFNALLITGNVFEQNINDGLFYTSVETIPLGGGNGTVNVIGNLFKQNGANGVDVEPTGSAVANVNLIGNTIIQNTQDGVRMQADKQSVIQTTSVGNIIMHNGGDGWQLTTQAATDVTFGSTINDGSGVILASLTDNNISFNGARGIDILNQWNGQMVIDIEGTVDPTTAGNIANPANDSNIIDGNGLQGIRIENASDLTLAQQDPLHYFGVFPQIQNILRVKVNQTEISGNGRTPAVPDDGDGILVNVGTSMFGYMNASLTKNHFSGNANIDVVTQSFVSTAQPAVGPLYDPATGAINIGFQPDPVARLALHFVGNVGNQVDMTRTGAFYGGTSQPADTFKTIFGVWNATDNQGNLSVTVFQSAGDVPVDEQRRRNAQREPGAFYQQNFGFQSVDNGTFIIGRDVIWDTQATGANPGSPSPTNAALYPGEIPPNAVGQPANTFPAYLANPNSVAATPAPSTSTFAAANAIIFRNNDYVNAYVQFLTGVDSVAANRIISGTTANNQQITVGQAYGTAPAPGDQFTITASELAGTGRSTFVTDSGPTVNANNTFNAVISDFTTQIGYLGFNSAAESQTPFGWRVAPAGSFGVGFP